MMKLHFKKKLVLCCALVQCLGFSYVQTTQAASLQEVLKYALNNDPNISEAKSNVDVAKEQTEISKAGHFPVISLTNTNVLTQKTPEQRDKKHSTVGVKGVVNLYAWGGIDASIERDKHKEAYFEHKLDETREQLGYTITTLYLEALKAKETIAAYQKSLKRHQKMLRNIQTIASYDEGRRSEVTEINSRLLRVEATIAEQQRILQTNLSKLNRYSPKPLSAESLTNPFPVNRFQSFIEQYRNPDLHKNPTIQAQTEELNSARADIKVAEAKRRPSLNLESELNNRGYAVYLGVSWNAFDLASSHTAKQSYYSEDVARAKVKNVLLEIEERARTSEIEMRQNQQYLNVIKKQIVAQTEVVKTYELQFDIARRSLLDVLNAYQELTAVEISEVDANNGYRNAAISYLVSQSRIADWIGLIKLNLPVK